MKWVILGVDVEIVEVGGLLGTNAEHNGPSRETPVGLDGSNHSNRSNRSNGCHGCCHGCCCAKVSTEVTSCIGVHQLPMDVLHLVGDFVRGAVRTRNLWSRVVSLFFEE